MPITMFQRPYQITTLKVKLGPWELSMCKCLWSIFKLNEYQERRLIAGICPRFITCLLMYVVLIFRKSATSTRINGIQFLRGITSKWNIELIGCNQIQTPCISLASFDNYEFVPPKAWITTCTFTRHLITALRFEMKYITNHSRDYIKNIPINIYVLYRTCNIWILG